MRYIPLPTRLLRLTLLLGLMALLMGQSTTVDAQANVLATECLDSVNIVCIDDEGDVEIGVPTDTQLDEFFTVYIPTADRQQTHVHFGNGEQGLWFTNGSQRGFQPFLYGLADDQRVSMYIAGSTTPENDIGRNALVAINGRYHGGASGGVIQTRPIFSVNNYQEPAAFLVDHNNRVGIGTTEPQAQLDVVGGPKWGTDTDSYQWGKSIRLQNTHAIEFLAGGGNSRFGIGARNNRVGLYFMVTNDSTENATASYPMMIRSNGNVGINTILPSSELHVNGTTTTGVLQITGGADIAEPFAVSDTTEVEPGTVVVLDADNPGELRVADGVYDRGVAGVISGAGNIQPGLIMQQGEAATVNGETHPVALVGKVYVKAVGPIQVSDLLTTSDITGHAMAATDRDQAFGATLGKAMSSLAEGETGLVLVLVALQ